MFNTEIFGIEVFYYCKAGDFDDVKIWRLRLKTWYFCLAMFNFGDLVRMQYIFL